MKSIWKWILGIIIAVAVIVAAVFGVRYLVSSGYITMPAGPAWHGPTARDFDGHADRMRAHDQFWREHGFIGAFGHGRGFGRFGPFMILGGLIRLAVFGALLYGAYWLGKRNARIVYDAAPAGKPVDETPKPRSRKVAKN